MSALPVSRRLVAVIAASGLCLTGLALATTASAADPTPSTGCVTRPDVKGDAVVSPAAGAPGYAEPELDLTGIVLGTTPTNLLAVLRVDALSTSPDTAAGHTFYANFTVNKKLVALVATAFDPAELGAPVDALAAATAGSPAQRSPLTRMTVDGTYVPSKLTAAFDTKASTVSFSIPRADVATAVGSPLTDGVPVAAVYGRDATSLAPGAGGLFVDSTAGDNATATTDKDVWTVGDNTCFGGSAPVGTPTGTPTPAPTANPLPRTDGEPVLFDQPRKGCVTYKDPAGDADPTPTGLDNEDSVDVTQVNLKSAAEGLQVYVKVADLTASPFPLFDSTYYDVSLSVGGKAIVVSVDQDGKATSTVGGTANADLKATAKLDTKNSVVIVTLPTDGLTKVLGAPLAQGAAVTNTAIASGVADSTTGFPAPADDAAGVKPEEKTYAYGDNTCFLPPAGTAYLDGLTGVYTDTATVVGSLQDLDEANVAGATLTLTIAGLPMVRAVTNDEGDATFRFPVTLPAGTRKAVLSFAGNATVGATKAEDAFVVAVESTVLKAVASKGAVTATLADNDRHAIAKRVVIFTVGSRSTKVTTNAKGQAILKGVAKGAVVKVSFAAVPTLYAAAKPVTVKAL